jgi:flagellar basal-body rod modification protein FlgD
MDSNDFLQLFIAQLQYQDPLSPQDPSTMLNQLSQLSLVEQSYNQTTALSNLLAAQNNSQSMNSVSFIGKTVKANGDSIAFDGSSSTAVQYNLSSASTATKLIISNSAGEAVRTVSLGAQSAGDNSYTWDGCDDSGTKLSSGAYTFSVSATTASGASVTTKTYTTGVIDGVNLANSDPYLTIGSVSVPLTNVVSVSGT